MGPGIGNGRRERQLLWCGHRCLSSKNQLGIAVECMLIKTSIDDWKPLLLSPKHELMCEWIIEISDLYSAQSGDAGILICLLHDFVIRESILLWTVSYRGSINALATSIATSSASCITQGIEVGYLRCRH